MKAKLKLYLIIGVFLSPSIALSQTVMAWGDSLTAGTGGISWPQQFESLSGIATLNRGVGGDTSTQIATRFLAEPSAFNDFTVIWAGRNNYSDPNTVEFDIAQMVSSLTTSNFLILGVVNGDYGGYETIGGTGYSFIAGINSNLAATYGSKYLDIRTILVNSYDPLLSQDVSDFARDIVPSSLRSDSVHLNTAGYGIVANSVYAAYSALLSGNFADSTSYHIGNSLTLNMQPEGIEAMAALTGKNHQVGYHILKGAHLDSIWSNPGSNDVVTNIYGDFISALPSYGWGFVTIQPFYQTGSTLGLDQAAISNFIDLTLAGPSVSPIFYIYSAWPPLTIDFQAFWDQPILNDSNLQTTHAREYFSHLYQNLVDQYGASIQLYMIPIGEVLYRLDQEFKQGNFPPYNSAGDLYRDTVHLTVDVGRFVAVTTVYSTVFKENPVGIERPIGSYLNLDGTTNLTIELRDFIQSIVWDVVSHHSLSGVDIIPDVFTFDAVLDSELNTVIYSNPISVPGINAATVISIVNGEYSVNGGSYISSTGTVYNDDMIVVRHTSADVASSSVDTVLAVGGVSGIFTSVTAAADGDGDGDGIVDNADNCMIVSNPSQLDTDNDGFGNCCDPDFDNDLIVNAADLGYFKTKFLSNDPDADLNGNGIVNAADLAILKTMFFKPPGPSGLVP